MVVSILQTISLSESMGIDPHVYQPFVSWLVLCFYPNPTNWCHL